MLAQVLAGLGDGIRPHLLVVAASAHPDTPKFVGALAEHFADASLVGGTSCLGVMTAEGFHHGEGLQAAVLAIEDAEGAYGVGAADLGNDPRAAGRLATEQALATAGREGEVPAMIWMTAAPGVEEAVLEGIADVVGPRVPVTGGSSADDNLSGQWQQFAGRQTYRNAATVAVLFPARGIVCAFHSGYTPSAHRGRVTRAEGRVIAEIDGRPAAEVYDHWTDGLLSGLSEGERNILSLTTMHPLGHEVGVISDLPQYQLAHPEAITDNGGLKLFCRLEPGEDIVLMTGSRESLVTRVSRVARAAAARGGIAREDIAGALVVYCAGAMLAVRDDMQRVTAQLREALGGAPFLGAFTFGEQGCFSEGCSRHANLMISVVLFEK